VPMGFFDLYELSEKAKPLKDSLIVKLFPILGMLFGLGFGIVLAIYFEMQDDKLRTLKQVDLIYNIPTLLFIPEFSFFGKRNGKEKTLYFIRHLSEKLDRMKFRRDKGEASCALSVSFTSSVVHEGKSCIAYFLALYYRQLGKKVMLMELDSTYNSFNSCQRYVPLEDYLEDKTAMDSIIFFDDVDRINVSEKGTLMKEGVKSPKMNQLMEKIKKEYDVIIMDLPGVIETDYTINLAAMSDIRLFVIGSPVVDKKRVDESLRDLLAAEIKPSGIILNRVSPIYIEDIRIKLELEKVKSSFWKKIFRR
jgi:succinoglycan biosynthesis transport protein ExoP